MTHDRRFTRNFGSWGPSCMVACGNECFDLLPSLIIAAVWATNNIKRIRSGDYAIFASCAAKNVCIFISERNPPTSSLFTDSNRYGNRPLILAFLLTRNFVLFSSAA